MKPQSGGSEFGSAEKLLFQAFVRVEIAVTSAFVVMQS